MFNQKYLKDQGYETKRNPRKVLCTPISQSCIWIETLPLQRFCPSGWRDLEIWGHWLIQNIDSFRTGYPCHPEKNKRKASHLRSSCCPPNPSTLFPSIILYSNWALWEMSWNEKWDQFLSGSMRNELFDPRAEARNTKRWASSKLRNIKEVIREWRWSIRWINLKGLQPAKLRAICMSAYFIRLLPFNKVGHHVSL